MSHFFTEDQELFKAAVKQFVDDEVRPRAQEINESGDFPADLYQRCVELGFVGLTAPVEYGGIEGGFTTFLMILEEIGRVSPNLALGLEVEGFAIAAIAGGTDEQKQKYLPGILDGSAYSGVFCCDPSGSSNIAEWPVGAKKVEGGYILNLQKVMVSYRKQATMCIFQAKHEGGVGLFIAPDMSVPEISVGGDYVKMGMHGSETGDVDVTDLFIPDADVIPFAPTPDICSIWIEMPAIALGACQEAFDKTLPYLLSRTKAGKPIATINGVGAKLAEWATELELMRNMLYNTCAMLERGDDIFTIIKMTSMCKAWIVRRAIYWLTEAIELNGSVGYITESGLPGLLSDVIGLRLAEYPEGVVIAQVEQCLGIPDVIA